MIYRSGTCAVNCFSILAEPFSYLMQTFHHRLFNNTFRSRSYPQHITTAFRYDLSQSSDHFLCRLVRSVRHPSPVIAQSDAAFPRIIQLSFRNTTLRSLVVLVFSADATVYGNQSRMSLARLFQHTIQIDVITRHPTAVEPENIEAAIISHQFIELILRKLHIILPPVRMLVPLIVLSAVRSGIIRIPIPLTMPVGLGKITSYHETFVTERVKHMISHVLARIVLERSVSDREIRIFGIKHTESVMMLGGENHIFHSRILHHFRPLLRIKLHRIEFILQSEVPFLVIHIRHGSVSRNPVYVFRTDRP